MTPSTKSVVQMLNGLLLTQVFGSFFTTFPGHPVSCLGLLRIWKKENPKASEEGRGRQMGCEDDELAGMAKLTSLLLEKTVSIPMADWTYSLFGTKWKNRPYDLWATDPPRSPL